MHPALTPTPEPQDMPTDPGVASQIVPSEPSAEPGIREAAMAPGQGMGENVTLGAETCREDEKLRRDMETKTLGEAEMCTESVSEREGGASVGVETLERAKDCSETTTTRTEVTIGEEIVEGTHLCSKTGTVRECAVTVVVKTLEESSMCSESRNARDGELSMGVEPTEVAEMRSETGTARERGICVGVEALKGQQICSETETARESETAGGNSTVASPEIDCREGKGANQEECIGSIGLSRCVAQQVDALSSEKVLMVSAIDASQVSVAVGEKTEETRRTSKQIPHDDSDLVQMQGTDNEECADPVGLTKVITEQVANLATEKGAVVTGSDASQVNIHMEVCINDGKITDGTRVIPPLVPQNDFDASQINKCMDIREETKIIGPLDGENNFDASQINTGERTEETNVIAPLVSHNDFDASQVDRNMGMCTNIGERTLERGTNMLPFQKDDFDVDNMEVDLEIPLKRKGDRGVIDENEVLRSKIEDAQAEAQFVGGETKAIGASLLQKEVIVAEVHADHLNSVSDSGNERKEKRKDEMLEGKIPGGLSNENQMQVEIPPNALLTEETVEQDHKHNLHVLTGGEDEEKTQTFGSQRQDKCLSTDREGMTDCTKDQQDRRLIVKENSEKRGAGERTCNVDFKLHAEHCSSESLLEKSSAQQDFVQVPEVTNGSVGEMDWERVRIPGQTSQPNTLFDANVVRTGSVLVEGDNETNTVNDCQVLRRETHSEADQRQEEVVVEVKSGDKMFTKKEPIKEDSIASFHDMEVDRLPGVNNELHKINTDALDTEEDVKKQIKELVLAKNEEEKGRMDDVKSTFAAHATGKSFVDADTTEGDGKINSEIELKWHSNTDMQVSVQSEDLVTAKKSPKIEGEEEKLGLSSGQQICVNIVQQVKKVDDVKDGEGSISSSFENHNVASSEGRVSEGKGIDGVANILGDLKHERAVLEEDKMRISVQGNIETSEKEKYVRTEPEKGEITVKATQKRKASENHASDSGGIMNGPSQAEISVKKAKKKPVNVWAKSSTSRKGGKKSNKNGTQPNVAKEDAVFLTPVFVNQDKLEDGPDQPIALSKTDKAEKIELSENRLSASSTKGYRMVRATRGVQEGTWYFEILVEQLGPTGHTRLGWSTQKGDVQAPVGFDSNSYGYRDVDGSKVHVAIREAYGDPYLEGDVIGFYIHLPNGTEFAPKPASLVSYRGRPYLSETKDEHPKKVPGSEICFFRNGVCQGTAFKDVNGGRYFPAASMYTMPKEPNCTVKFNFGPNFQYPPENIGTRPPPMAMCFAPYHNGMGGKESRAVPSVNDSSPVTSMQNREPHIYGSI